MDCVCHATFHALHAWDLQECVLHALKDNLYTMVHVMITALNMTRMEIVWLHALQDFINLQTQFVVRADRIVKNATTQLHAQNARLTCMFIWVIVWLLALQILWYQQTTYVLLAMFLVELVKTSQLNVSRVQLDTITIQDQKDV